MDDSDDSDLDTTARMPWIEKHSATKKSQLAVDPIALEKTELWLRSWKNDIKVGKSRKLTKKRRRHSSESDFVTSDEEGSELRSKCLVLYGQTGCGKTTTVSTLAKKMGFKIVEVNFSSARPGKQVLKRVEEATLSHRLESSQTCLLLFKDICLMEPKEDEGFTAAVAQLITTSCRPIVMTMTSPGQSGSLPPVAGDCDSFHLDVKIEKKEPLYVNFKSQPASVIVQKVLLPIVESEFPDLDTQDGGDVQALLYSIARHCKGDVRHSVNQLQIFVPMYSIRPTLCTFRKYLSPYIDLDFVRHPLRQKQEQHKRARSRNYRSYRFTTTASPLTVDLDDGGGHKAVVMKDDSDQGRNPSGDKIKSKELIQEELKSLNSLVKGLDFAINLDRVTTFLQHRSHHDLKFDEDLKAGRHHVFMECFTDCMQQYCSLTGDSNGHSLCPQMSKEFLLNKVERRVKSKKSRIVCSDSESEASNDATPNGHSVKTDSFELSSFIFDNDEDMERKDQTTRLTTDMDEYCGTEGDLMTSGQFNYQNFALVRSIVKINKLQTVGPYAKRHRRLTTYFNRLSVDLIDRICATFDFETDLNVAKLSATTQGGLF